MRLDLVPLNFLKYQHKSRYTPISKQHRSSESTYVLAASSITTNKENYLRKYLPIEGKSIPCQSNGKYKRIGKMVKLNGTQRIPVHLKFVLSMQQSLLWMIFQFVYVKANQARS
jgi:hypothetical protein